MFSLSSNFRAKRILNMMAYQRHLYLYCKHKANHLTLLCCIKSFLVISKFFYMHYDTQNPLSRSLGFI